MQISFHSLKVFPVSTGNAIYWLLFKKLLVYLHINSLVARSLTHIVPSQPKTTQASAGKATCEISYHVVVQLLNLCLIGICSWIIRRKQQGRISEIDYLKRNISLLFRGLPISKAAPLILSGICNISFEKRWLIKRIRWVRYLIRNEREFYSVRRACQANWWLVIFV